MLSSCDLFKKVPPSPDKPEEENVGVIEGRRVYDPTLGQWVIIREMPTEKLDTIKWTNISKEVSPPIVSYGDPFSDEEATRLLRTGAMGSQFFTRYQVSMLLPFLADDFSPVTNTINDNSFWALHYYSGAQLALKELEREGVKMDLSVYDSRGDQSTVQRLLNLEPKLKSSHLIIGPYRRDNVKQLAEFAKVNDITYVSPYSGTANLSTDNPNYIQISPTLETHCRSLVREAKKRFRPEQIVLVCQDNQAERSWLQYFQNEHFLMEGSDMTVPPLLEYVVPATNASFPNLQFDSLFARNDSIALIVPSWSEPFVYNLLRKADLAKYEEFHLEIYGLPQWMFFEQIDYDYYEKLKVRVSSNLYLDSYSRSIQGFKQRYYNEFGVLPRTESFLGYDVMLYFGRMLQKHGTKFQYSLDQEKAAMLHTRFEFMPRMNPRTEFFSQQIEQFENKFVHILEFRDYLFQPLGN